MRGWRAQNQSVRICLRRSAAQAFSRASYRAHEEWRTTIFRELQQLEGEGLLVIRQLIPCARHGKCHGQPVAAGCELTRKGQRLRDESTL